MLMCIFFVGIVFAGIALFVQRKSPTYTPRHKIPVISRPSQNSPLADFEEGRQIKKVLLPIEIPTTDKHHGKLTTHKHNELIFSFPTVGIPEPGKTYNNTPVKDLDLPIFDELLNDLLKPYNVKVIKCRIQTVNQRGLVRIKMEDTYFAAILCFNLKLQ